MFQKCTFQFIELGLLKTKELLFESFVYLESKNYKKFTSNKNRVPKDTSV